MARKKDETLKFGVSNKLVAPKATIPQEGMEIRNACKDSYTYLKSNYDNFIEMLNNKEKYTCRAIVASDNMTFAPLNDKIYKRLLNGGYPKDILDDALENTGLVCKMGKFTYPIGSSAMPGLWRIAISNRDLLPKNIIADFFNGGITQQATQRGRVVEYQALTFGGKLDGLVSSIYTPFPPNVFIAHGKTAIEDTYGAIECVGTYFDHAVFKATFALKGEEATNMAELFREQIVARHKRHNIKIKKKDINIEFGLVIKTGETGNETATIRSHVSLSRGAGISIGEDIVLYHKGEKDIEKEISDKIGNVFLSFQDTINRLIVACDVKVLDWRSTIVGLSEFAKIPEEVWKKIIVNFEKQYKGAEVVTGYDILQSFLNSTIIYKDENPNATENMLNLYEMKVLKIMNEDISKYDNDEGLIKKQLSEQYLTYGCNVLVAACDELGIPVAIRKNLVNNYNVKAQMYALANMGEEMPTTALDIYELIVNSGSYMREWYSKRNLEKAELESKMAKYSKSLTKAKRVCYIALDKEA
jgi:hypothetical protein